MARLRCNDYGFECEYNVEGEVEQMVEDFKKHMLEEHGIEYSREALLKFISREEEYP